MTFPISNTVWHTDSIYYAKLLPNSKNVRLVTLKLQDTSMDTVVRLIRLLKIRCAPVNGNFLSRRLQFVCFSVSGKPYMAISGIAEDKNHLTLLPSIFQNSYLYPTLEQYNIEIEVTEIWMSIPVN